MVSTGFTATGSDDTAALTAAATLALLSGTAIAKTTVVYAGRVITDASKPALGPSTVVVTDDELDIPIEAQSFSTFGANHCDGSRHSERLVAHELAHQWFGNSVTLERWRDIWLHEGFACYAEWLWSQRSGGPSADECARKYYQKLRSTAVRVPLADPTPAKMFDDWVYKRGAITLHALRLRIGDGNFFALIRRWTEKYRYGTATTEDFISLAANYSTEPLGELWQQWLFTPALPPYPGPGK